jgi:biotin carboxyl carrier protein
MSDKIVTIGDEQTEIALERDGSVYSSGEHVIEVLDRREDEMEIRVDGRLSVVPFVVQGSTVSFAFDGEIYFADVTDKGARTRVRHRDHSTSAPMPGLVLKILVSPGDVVTKGAALLILEAMKMEHQITAPFDGKIGAVRCAAGEMVQTGTELVEVIPDENHG